MTNEELIAEARRQERSNVYPESPAYTNTMLGGLCDALIAAESALVAAKADVLAEVHREVAAEALTDDTGEPEDVGYNQAITDVLRILEQMAS